MDNKIFLLSKNSKFSTNKDSYINVDLAGDKRLMPNTDISETFSLYELYNNERDACNKFRLIFNINPICTNMCYNKITEIVQDEGGDGCRFHKAQETRIKYISNTEKSHPELGNYTYHCGVDIFDNHILRATDFPFIGKFEAGDFEAGDNEHSTLNTLLDSARDQEGTPITELDIKGDEINGFVYNTDNNLSIYDAFNDKCIEKDGWVGFENKSLIDIPNCVYEDKNGETKTITVNRVINNKKACSFVDLYPERDLFSFTPKYNKSRNRNEYNWDYCITYPYRNDKDKFNEINNNGIGAIRTISHKIVYTNSGEELIEMECLFKHNLKRGSFITLYYTNSLSFTTPKSFPTKIKIVRVGTSEGDKRDTVFVIRFSDVSNLLTISDDKIILNGNEITMFFFKRNINGIKCDYYFRVFRKYLNYNNEMPTSDISKLAYAKNIFGDNLSQLIYTEDIDVTGLVDNIGRPVSELYLTIIKTNRGHIEWYSDSANSENVEYSHAFGKVTSGIELPESFLDYNIHKLHNLELDKVDSGVSKGTLAVFSNFEYIPKAIEGGTDSDGEMDYSGITMSNDEFYGDIVEFNLNDFEETVIDKVYHRFNTSQREECGDSQLYNYFHTIITKDINEVDKDGNITQIGKPYYINDAIEVNSDGSTKSLRYAGNLAPEGYVYNPNYKIKIREISDELKSVTANFINYDGEDDYTEIVSGVTYIEGLEKITTITDEYGDEYSYDLVKIKSPVKDSYKVGSTFAFYDIEEDSVRWGIIASIEDSCKLSIRVEHDSIDSDKLFGNAYLCYFLTEECPMYAKLIVGQNSFVWRDLVKPSKMLNEMELFDTPFANGAFYVQKNINFFLKTQDPTGEYHMKNVYTDPRGVTAIEANARRLVKKPKLKIDLSAFKTLSDLFKNTCE